MEYDPTTRRAELILTARIVDMTMAGYAADRALESILDSLDLSSAIDQDKLGAVIEGVKTGLGMQKALGAPDLERPQSGRPVSRYDL